MSAATGSTWALRGSMTGNRKKFESDSSGLVIFRDVCCRNRSSGRRALICGWARAGPGRGLGAIPAANALPHGSLGIGDR